MSKAKVIYVKISFVECPECEAEVSDIIGDPSGDTLFCPECNTEFSVLTSATLELDPRLY